ncbi:luciferase-like domain-containing protein [Dactylonectria macrodidyma]|uniref:Luciferase-like domain-containing protein n=1 Tax=Dactylonectria macrodidyma TaxID=307937 RepID=A0A9P9EQ16_9HYPO|nr:luciferase-like domain-containing protein [Dactylonectria macrodidyma]
MTAPDITGLDKPPKKQILLNAFDMSTVGHLSVGHWKNPTDRSATKRKLTYWVELAKLLERGGISGLFLADTNRGFDTYGGSVEESIRRAVQWPVTDPAIPITAMAAATKNLTFGITASTSFESPFVLAKRFSTLDHMTDGRIGWNIVTSWKKSAFNAIGMDPVEHNQRYAQADEYMRILYKLWEGSWADDALQPDPSADTYIDPSKVRHINHQGKYYKLSTRHIVDPSPQRTPFLFQAGSSAEGIDFAATHAEGIFVSSPSPELLRAQIEKNRKIAAEKGRDPRSLKFYLSFTPILGKTDEEAQEKFRELGKNASPIGGLVLFSGWTRIDMAKLPLDEDISKVDSHEARKLCNIFKPTAETPVWTPRLIGEKAAMSGISPSVVGSPATVADVMERWIEIADLDGFNLGYVTSPGSFEDVVELLVPELRRRGSYPEAIESGLTARERVYGKGQARLRDDHVGSKYKYEVYQEEEPYVVDDQSGELDR